MSATVGGLRPSAARERFADRFRDKSLTWRLLAVLIVLLVVALTLTSIATSAIMRRYLVDRTVEELQTAAAPVAARVLPQYLNRDDAPDVPSSYVVAIMGTDGQPVATLVPPGIDAASLPQLSGLTPGDERVRSREPFVLPAGDNGPAWVVVAGEMGNSSGTYAVATSLAGVEQTINKTIAASFTVSLLFVLLCVFIGWIGFRRAFRPLRTIEDTAAAIAAGDLTRRVPEHAAHDEVRSLSGSINAMLAQIEEAFRVREASEKRMRRFVTDASHELRTPLATVRGYAELYRQGAVSTPEQTAVAMSRIENEATRMAGLVDDLLTLARLDNERPMTLRTVDLTVLAADAVQDARARDASRTIRMLPLGRSFTRTEVIGDDARLRQVITNLLANALAHTPEGSPIEVVVGRRETSIRLEVRDHGRGLTPEDAAKVFERFYRNDPARGRRKSGGYGLGLAIVAAIVESHGGRVGVATTPGGGATFVIELPAAAPETTEDDDIVQVEDPFDPVPAADAHPRPEALPHPSRELVTVGGRVFNGSHAAPRDDPAGALARLTKPTRRLINVRRSRSGGTDG